MNRIIRRLKRTNKKSNQMYRVSTFNPYIKVDTTRMIQGLIKIRDEIKNGDFNIGDFELTDSYDFSEFNVNIKYKNANTIELCACANYIVNIEDEEEETFTKYIDITPEEFISMSDSDIRRFVDDNFVEEFKSVLRNLYY